jgi:hypothetical protein
VTFILDFLVRVDHLCDSNRHTDTQKQKNQLNNLSKTTECGGAEAAGQSLCLKTPVLEQLKHIPEEKLCSETLHNKDCQADMNASYQAPSSTS